MSVKEKMTAIADNIRNKIRTKLMVARFKNDAGIIGASMLGLQEKDKENMSIAEKMTAIADAIREKTGGTDALTLDGMAEAIPEVYDAGKQSEYDSFWDIFQQNGKRTNYNRAFFSETMAQRGWNDENYNPKYDIVTTSGAQTFWCALITDTKVPITLKDGCNANTMFGSCTKLVAIPKLILEGTVSSWANAFIACNSLEEIEFEGVIDNNIDFLSCQKLVYKSLMNIIEHLKDFSDTTTTRTLTLGTENLAKLTDTEKAIATQKGWTLA